MNTEKKVLGRFFKNIKGDLIADFKYMLLFLAALLFWELLLRSQNGFKEMSFYFLLFLPAVASFFAAVTGWLNTKLNRIVTPIVMLLPFAFYVSQLVYFRIFGSLFSVSMISLGTNAVGNFGWALWDTIKSSILWIILCLLPVIASVILSFKATDNFFKGSRALFHAASVLRTVLLWLLAVLLIMPFGMGDHSPYYAYRSPYIDTDTASNQLGVFTNSVVELGHMLFGSIKEEEIELVVPNNPGAAETPPHDWEPNVMAGIDFEALKNATDDEGKKALCDYFAATEGSDKNEYTGLLRDYNLIYICAEAFCNYAVDPEITPTLYKLSRGGFVLNNFYNSFKNTTTNGEYAFMTGLWPDVSRDADAGSSSGSFVQSVDKSIPFAPGNMFENAGVKAYAYHNFLGYYYSREKTHPNLGYSTARFMNGNNGMHFTTSWPSSDYEMMQQSVDDYINNDRFHAYYMTFSGHGPYSNANKIGERNIETVRKLAAGRELDEAALYYLAANYELEKAMTYLLERLESAGKLNNTMIVLVGDHYPYYLNSTAFDSLAGKKVDRTFERYESACIMWCNGIEPVQVDVPCCNVDILPTVLNLFGFEYDSRLLPGTDILSNGTHIAMLYNKSFVTEKVKYNAQNGRAQWLSPADGMTDAEKSQYLEYHIAPTKMQYKLSLELMNEDFYKFVADNRLPQTP